MLNGNADAEPADAADTWARTQLPLIGHSVSRPSLERALLGRVIHGGLMKTLRWILVLLSLSFVTGLCEAQKVDTAHEAHALLSKGLIGAMQELGIPSSYNARYDLIFQLYDAGIVLFDAASNSPVMSGKPPSKYWYVGNPSQNRKLLRNIVENRHLFKNGKLPKENAAKWKVVP